jgi:putative transposase
MQVYHNPDTSAPLFPENVIGNVIGESLMRSLVPIGFTEKALEGIMASAQDGLLNLCKNIGLEVVKQMMDQELDDKIGPKGKHNPDRQAYRNGYEAGSVVLGGCKHAISRPRARTIDGNEEIMLETYKHFNDEEVLTRAVLNQIIYGVSCRNYRETLEGIDTEAPEVSDVSKSSVSRRFIKATSSALEQLMNRPLGDLDIVAIYIDGIGFGKGHLITAAIGLDIFGHKHILGIWEGATENKTLCSDLLTNLLERGLKVDNGILAIIDGSKALSAAIKAVFGPLALIQRCQIHKMRNILDYLPEKEQEAMETLIKEAFNDPDPQQGKQTLLAEAARIEKKHPGAAASIREGLDEMFTVARLALDDKLTRTLTNTNVIESAFSMIRSYSCNVKNWQSGDQALRWAAAGALLAEERFNRIKGYKELASLRQKLRIYLSIETSDQVATA